MHLFLLRDGLEQHHHCVKRRIDDPSVKKCLPSLGIENIILIKWKRFFTSYYSLIENGSACLGNPLFPLPFFVDTIMLLCSEVVLLGDEKTALLPFSGERNRRES